jgi:nucleoid DNA-binding protein
MSAYAALNDMKDRLLITLSDTQYDDALNTANNEASAIVDTFLSPYVPFVDGAGNNQEALPLNSADVQIQIITADIAVSVFKRRMMPEDITIKGQMITPDNQHEMEARGWFGQGIQKLETYIRSYCVLAQEVGNIVHNPEVYMNLYKKGIITAKEAREFVDGCTAISNYILETLTKHITDTETIDITKALNETLNLTKTSVLSTNDTQNLAKTVVQTVTDTLNKTLNQDDAISVTKAVISSLNESINRTVDTSENLTKTSILTTNDTVSEYKTRRQRYFGFISSDKNDGYKVDSDSETNDSG